MPLKYFHKVVFSGQNLYTNFAGVAQLVEHYVANVIVVGSNPITRSIGDAPKIIGRTCWSKIWYGAVSSLCGCGGTGRRASLRS